jgi:hypothetical protein
MNHGYESLKINLKPKISIMKKIIYLLLTVAISSCAMKEVPLKNKYDEKPFEITTTSDFETVWGKTIEYFAKSGIGVKLLDKATGFIVAQNTAAPITVEDKNGKLENPDAWAVTAKMYDPGSKMYYHSETEVPIEWNIYMKKNTDGGTTININLIKVEASISMYNFGQTTSNPSRIIKTRALTTGVFERRLADIIK